MNPTKYVIAYYVMTVDVTVDLAPEQFTLSISGAVNFSPASISAYDPINNVGVPVTVITKSGSSLQVI